LLRPRPLAWSGVTSGVKDVRSGVTSDAQGAQSDVRNDAQARLLAQAQLPEQVRPRQPVQVRLPAQVLQSNLTDSTELQMEPPERGHLRADFSFGPHWLAASSAVAGT
jgi:hypothetical protein